MAIKAETLENLLSRRNKIKTSIEELTEELKTIDDTIKTSMEEDDIEELFGSNFKVFYRPNDTSMVFNKTLFIKKYGEDNYNTCLIETLRPYYRVLPIKQ